MVSLSSDETALSPASPQFTLAHSFISQLNPLEKDANELRFRLSKQDKDRAFSETQTCRDYLFDARKQLTSTIKLERIKQFIPAAIAYMSDAERDYWHSLFSELLVASLYQYNLDVCLDRKRELSDQQQNLAYYLLQLQRLEQKGVNRPVLVQDDELSVQNSYAQQWLADRWTAANTAPVSTTIDWMSDINWYRLYWVWTGGSGGFLGSILDLEPVKQLPGRDQASNRLESPGNTLGHCSWVLYSTRFLLNLGLMLKHTTAQLGQLNEDEQQVDAARRWQAQWDQRKFIMLNDLVWGWVNGSSFMWFTSSVSPAMGVIGGLLNVILMSFDVSMAMLDLSEQTRLYQDESEQLKARLAASQQQLHQELATNQLANIEQVFALREYLALQQRLGQGTLANEAALQARLQALAKQLTTVQISEIPLETCMKLIALDRLQFSLQQDSNILDFQWHYKKLGLESTLSLAMWFVPAMVLMFANIFPVMLPALAFSAAMQANLIFIGCVMSVVLTAYEPYYTLQLEVDKHQVINQGLAQKQGDLLGEISMLWPEFKLLEDGMTAESEHHALLISNLNQCQLEYKRLQQH